MSDQDLKLAEALLIGRLEWDRKDRPHTKYLKGVDEKEARQAIARLLLNDDNPFDSRLRRYLAALFTSGWRGRKLKFGFAKGGRPEDVTGVHLFTLVLGEVQSGKRTMKAIESVADELSLSIEHVTRAWSRYSREYLTPAYRRRVTHRP